MAKGPKPRPIADRFLAKVRQGEKCWEWTGSTTPAGYGKILVSKSKLVGAHRVSYELFCGPIPFGMNVLHRCDAPGCVRPDHLFLGTFSDNSQDMAMKGRTKTKLKPEDAYAILWRSAAGESSQDLAEEYGVTRRLVWLIAQRKAWKSLSVSHD